ncbi:MAG: translation initiation factor [Bacteroidia bacterium]|nr:translation initiation factor [Bacteroidia bacterium]MDW8334732.1 translation initiation factor [Bacteroidia bacterium]
MGIVYSTDPDFRPTIEDEEPQTLPPHKQDLRLTLDKKLKAGKKATVVYNFVGKSADLERLGKALKAACGVGGTVKNGEIILQGDHLEKVKNELTKMGYRFKLAGV